MRPEACGTHQQHHLGKAHDMTALHTAPAGPQTSPPPASRASAPGWRDPRLVLGVVLVAACVLVGSRLLAGADDTVAVWSLRHDVPAGAALTASDLTAVRVHFADGAGQHYLSAAADLADGATAAHDLTAGELLPRSALAAGAQRALVEVPLSVAPDDLPAGIGRGATVDVWVVPDAPGGADEHARARLALDDVVVVAVPSPGDSLAPRTTRQVIVGVGQDQADGLAESLGQLAGGRVLLTRRAAS
jgi:hypothetical protein